MGQGYGYVCKKCGHEYHVDTGIGMLFPQVYRNTIKEIAEGKNGQKRKDLYKKIPFLAVDAEAYYYECEDCGYWSVEQGMDLYKPKNTEKIRKQQFGEKTVEEWGEVPYVMNYELKYDYILVDKYDHRCPKCCGQMKKRNKTVISCPKCGTKNRPVKDVLWD